MHIMIDYGTFLHLKCDVANNYLQKPLELFPDNVETWIEVA